MGSVKPPCERYWVEEVSITGRDENCHGCWWIIVATIVGGGLVSNWQGRGRGKEKEQKQKQKIGAKESIRDMELTSITSIVFYGTEFQGEFASIVLDMINDTNYLYRMTILHAISLLAPVLGSEITSSKLLPLVINASKDRVPNIKFFVAKVLQSIIPVLDQSVVEMTIRPCLAELSEDPDVDVRFFATQALQSNNQVGKSS